MGHGHSHSAAPADVEVPATARRALVGFIVAIAAATLTGLVLLWPSGDPDSALTEQAQYARDGISFIEARVVSVLPPCPDDQGSESGSTGSTSTDDGTSAGPSNPTCNAMTVRLPRGPATTLQIQPEVAESGVGPGDTVLVVRTPASEGAPETYNYVQTKRATPLLALVALFVLLVAVVARWKGVLALVGVAVGGLVLFFFMLPALLAGSNGVAVAAVGSSAIMLVVLYLAHGVSIRTSTALAGTLLGVAVTTVVGILGVRATHLTGISDDDGALLATVVRSIDPHDLLYCAIIVAGLGVLNDVTITQSSAVWELRAASPEMTRAHLFASGMRIGRDHIASTIYTIVFAYAGAALPLLLLLSLYDRPALELMQQEGISQEIVSTMASAIGLVLAVPITTAIAAWTVGGPVERAQHATSMPAPEPAAGAAQPPRDLTAVDPEPPPRTRAERRARAERQDRERGRR